MQPMDNNTPSIFAYLNFVIRFHGPAISDKGPRGEDSTRS